MEKKIGKGSLSLLLSIFAFMFSAYNLQSSMDNMKLGEYVLSLLNIPIHYNVITILILLISFYFGSKYSNHIFAKAGKLMSLGLILIFLFIAVLGILQQLGFL